MTHLVPIPFAALLRRLSLEPARNGALFGLPAKRWHRPAPDLNLEVEHCGRRASNPLGIAAGPHTQMAQNIALGWLGGARLFELKTVQVLDELEIPRPSIHTADRLALNVEWSQELSLEESLREAVKAAWLVEILARTGAGGRLDSCRGARSLFEASVGYDLAGLRSERVLGFLRGLLEPEAVIAELRAEIPGELAAYRDLAPAGPIAEGITLSTFHGCPPDQIEAMARFLLEELGLHTTIKLNPTLLGFERVEELLHERLGYRHLELDPEVFARDLAYADALALLRRLGEAARRAGRQLAIKLTNTLVVRVDRALFPTEQGPHMYLSGRPLHALALELLERLRADLGADFPIAFSAGIDRRNFPALVARGAVPVSVCTDLLRPGGYGRLPAYLRELGDAMGRAGVRDLAAFRAARGAQPLAPLLVERYRYRRTDLAARRREGPLPLYDCSDCGTCLGVCPNGAIFAWGEPRQIGIFADACNECSNCALHCAMGGAPFLVKERFYSTRSSWERDRGRDGMVLDGELLRARFAGATAEESERRRERAWRGVYRAVKINPVNVLAVAPARERP